MNLSKTYIFCRFDQLEARLSRNIPGDRDNCLNVMRALIEGGRSAETITEREIFDLQAIIDKYSLTNE